MSWIDKELKRRAAAMTKRSAPRPPPTVSATDRMQELWSKLERANEALPNELRLYFEPGKVHAAPAPNSPDDVAFVAWLRAQNGAALGFSGDAVRYVWPKANRRKSNNFWIRWDADQERYLLSRRVNSMEPSIVASYVFDEAQTERMIKCLVLGKRISARSVRRKRLWFF